MLSSSTGKQNFVVTPDLNVIKDTTFEMEQGQIETISVSTMAEFFFFFLPFFLHLAYGHNGVILTPMIHQFLKINSFDKKFL